MLSFLTSGASRWRRADRAGAGLHRALPAALAALLVACGGGGGDGSATPGAQVSGPPTVAAVLGNSPADAAQSAQAAVGGAAAAVTRANSLSGLSALFGGSVGSLQVHLPATRQVAMSAGHDVQPLAVQTAACTDLLSLPCVGSATVDTDIVDTANVIRAGNYADLRFLSLSGNLLGQRLTLSGRMRIDFLSTIDLNAAQNPGLDLKLLLDGFGGSVNGQSFGPISDLSRLQVDAQGVGTLTAGGASYTGMTGTSVSDNGSYVIGGGRVRQAHWADPNRYVDVTLQNWQVLGNRPTVGSQAVVAAGSGSIAIQVVSSSIDSVVYAVTLNVGGPAVRYVVTASYPAGGGAPSYTAAVAAT